MTYAMTGNIRISYIQATFIKNRSSKLGGVRRDYLRWTLITPVRQIDLQIAQRDFTAFHKNIPHYRAK